MAQGILKSTDNTPPKTTDLTAQEMMRFLLAHATILFTANPAINTIACRVLKKFLTAPSTASASNSLQAQRINDLALASARLAIPRLSNFFRFVPQEIVFTNSALHEFFLADPAVDASRGFAIVVFFKQALVMAVSGTLAVEPHISGWFFAKVAEGLDADVQGPRGFRNSMEYAEVLAVSGV